MREQQQQRQGAIERRQSQRDDMRSRTKKGQPVMSRVLNTLMQRLEVPAKSLAK